MKILLCGDSWGIGVYKQNGDKWDPTGEGIQSILEKSGNTVYNISKGGGSNWLMVDRLNDCWDNFDRCLYGVDPFEKIDIPWDDINAIIFLQTDIFREHYLYDESMAWQKKLDEQFSNSLITFDTINHFIDYYFLNFYTALNDMALRKNKKIYMVGCWSQLHPSIEKFSNLVPVIHSAIKWLLPSLDNDVYLSDPEWYIQLASNKRFMNKFGNEWKEMTIQANTKLDMLYSTWHEVHPDINGYKVLTDQILSVLAKNN